VSTADYLVGMLLFVGAWAAAATAAAVVVGRRMGQLRGVTRFLAWAVVATAAIIAAAILPALLGILDRWTLLASAVLIAAAAALVPGVRAAGPPGFPTPAQRGGDVDRVLAAVGVAGFAIWVAVAAIEHRAAAPAGFDAASAYLPTAARWIQAGSIWGIHDWVPNAFYGSGPGNGSVIVAAAILPWHDDFVARFAIYPFIALTAVGLYALARELRAPPPAAALGGVMLTSIPVVVQPGLVDALLDPVLYATFAAGLAFGVRHSRTGARSDLALAALALGIAFGTKFYGYTSVAAVVAIWVVARLWARVRPLRVARETLAAGAIILAAGGVWMLRDWIAAGNPLLPVRVHALGVTIWSAPPDPLRPRLGATLASYLDQPSVWTRYLAHQFRIGAGFALPLLALAVAVAVIVLARDRRRGRRGGGVAWTLVAMAVALAIVYAVTPYSAPGPSGRPFAAVINIRYGVPALIAALGVAGYLAARTPRRWLVLIEAAALAATIDALRVGTTTAPIAVYLSFAAAGVLVVAVRLVAGSGPARPRVPSRAAIVLGAALLLAVLVAIGARAQRTYDADRYRGADPALDFLIAHTPDGAPVGLAGAWTVEGVSPIYPSFGPRLGSRVDYLGTVDDGLLRSYRHRGPFTAALRRDRSRILVVGRSPHLGLGPAAAALYSARVPPPLRTPPEERWARRLGYREVARSPRFVVMARPGVDARAPSAAGRANSASRGLRATSRKPARCAQAESGPCPFAGADPSPTTRRS
jgi:hypothetical protein